MNDDIADEFEHAGVPVKIVYQPDVDDNDNPRENQTNLGVMLCSHPHYNLGDEQIDDADSYTEVECSRCEGSGEDPERWEITRTPIVASYSHPARVVGAGSQIAMEAEWSSMIEREDSFYLSLDPATCPVCKGEGRITLDLFTYLKRERGATVILPLFLLDHSGLSIRAGANRGSFDRRNRFVGDEAGWDTSSVGVIFDTKETREETGAPLDDIERQLRNEVSEYDSYLRGEVYGFIVAEDTWVEESCWGFLGDIKYAREEAEMEARGVAKRLAREKAEAAYWAACDVVTL